MKTFDLHGWQPGMDDVDYFADPAISFSDMSLALKGALAYRNRKLYPLEGTALSFGSDFHNLMLFNRWPEKITPATKKHLEAMHAQLLRVSLFKDIMEKESKLVETPGFFGGQKIKPDIACPDWGILIDLKTTSDASPEAFKWSAKKFNYHLQAYHYLDVANKIHMETNGYTRPVFHTFLFVAIEKSAPYTVRIHECSPGVLEAAHELKVRALNTINRFRAEGVDALADEEQEVIHPLDFPVGR